MAGVEIDDAEAAHPDRGMSVDVDAFIIGAAMAHRVAHAASQCYERAGLEHTGIVYGSDNGTHGQSLRDAGPSLALRAIETSLC